MSTLESYLTTIADAIRQKKGTTEPINASNFASEILSIQGGGSLNVAYSLTPPTDTSKIWLQCAEPSSVEVQNYLGECAVSSVANWGVIDNPVDGHSDFYSGYYSSCYIGNNQIAIVGYSHIRIYDLTSKSYIDDYTLSMGVSTGTSRSYNYTNVLFKDNILYFALYTCLYSFDLATQTTTKLYDIGNSDCYAKYIFFNSDNEIYIFYYNSSTSYSIVYKYDITNGETTFVVNSSLSYFGNCENHTIKANNTVYNFYMYTTTSSTNKYTWKYSLLNNSITKFTSFYNFMTELGWTEYYYSSGIYDGERYIYLIGGYGKYNGTYSYSDLIIKYDTINDTFELLDNKLLGIKYYHFSVLVDNRVYMFGGATWTSNDVTYGRPNQIDYFDLSYPLNQNNCIITTNTINTDNALPLINTDKLKINSNIASAYLGNANNLAEKVNAYYWNGTKWVGINCADYVESESNGTGGGLNGGGDATTDPEIPVDKPVEI